MEQQTSTSEPSKTTAGRRLAVMHGADAPVVTGRRAYFEYRDLGVREATDGWMRAEVTSSRQGLGQTTGWHYHPCQGQYVYVLSGWIELAFEDGSVHRLDPGDSVFIPGGLRHNEINSSDEFDALEVSVPAQLETVACEVPNGLEHLGAA